MRRLLVIMSAIIVIASCAGTGAGETEDLQIWPDYADVTVPVNIAPLDFIVEGAGSVKVTVEGNGSYTFRSSGGTMRFPQRRWRRMLDSEVGNVLSVTVTASGRSTSFTWAISPDRIDKYISYRLIEPAYEVWNRLTIEERDIESFRERTLADNSLTGMSCMNCHISNRAESPTSFLHARSKGGGTLYSRGGSIRKIDTSSDSTAGPAVYGEISADGRYGIFTTADIRPALQNGRLGRLEVFDASSDLVLIDFEKNTISDSPSVKGPDFQETFPCWSADCKTIYFCRARAGKQPENVKQMHYDLCSVEFDPQSGRIGKEITTIIDAGAIGKSVSFPKCSPDGRYILLSVSDYGTFPIWQTETDLWMYDIATGAVDTMALANGEYSDSYHCWSTSGRWICWASKRGDRVYGRPYFAHVDSEGKVSKALMLPQRDPRKYLNSFKSYNIPELYSSEECINAFSMRRFYSEMVPEKLKYESR